MARLPLGLLTALAGHSVKCRLLTRGALEQAASGPYLSGTTGNTSASNPYEKMMQTDPQSDVDSMESAQSLAKTGAKLGAAAGARFGPVATGLASGVGGAVGYLAGNAVDTAEKALDEKRALTDGGHPEKSQESDGSQVMIPVNEEPSE